jgi:hypothetical protein
MGFFDGRAAATRDPPGGSKVVPFVEAAGWKVEEGSFMAAGLLEAFNGGCCSQIWRWTVIHLIQHRQAQGEKHHPPKPLLFCFFDRRDSTLRGLETFGQGLTLRAPRMRHGLNFRPEPSLHGTDVRSAFMTLQARWALGEVVSRLGVLSLLLSKLRLEK